MWSSPGVCVGSSRVFRLLSSCRRTRLWWTAPCSGWSVDDKGISRLHSLRKQIFECVRQDVRDLLPVCCGQCATGESLEAAMVTDLTPGWEEWLSHWLIMNLNAFTVMATRMRRNRPFIIVVNIHIPAPRPAGQRVKHLLQQTGRAPLSRGQMHWCPNQ